MMEGQTVQTVFVIDDDAAVRDSIAELVESVGLLAECYASALAFLDALEPDRPGCLVLDVRMAEMSGLVLQQKLRALRVRIPVIMLTGHGDVPMAVETMKAGAVDFLQKPYREQALLDSINAALSMDAAARRSSAAGDNFDQHLAALTAREWEVLDHLRMWFEAAEPEPGACLVLDAGAGDLVDPQRSAQFASACARMPVLVLTNRGDVHTAVQALKQGAADVIQKPLRDENLLDRINRAVAAKEYGGATS